MAYDRRRHARPEDPDLGRFPDPDDLLGVVAYLSQYQRVPEQILADDALDQLRILDHLLGEVDRRRLAAMRSARRRGKTWQAIAEAMGLRSRQGAESLFIRLAYAAEAPGNVKDDRQARAERRVGRANAAAAPAARRSTELRGLVQELLRAADQLPEDVVDDLRYLSSELDRGRHGGARLPESFEAQLRLTVLDIREAGVPSGLRSLMQRAEKALGE